MEREKLRYVLSYLHFLLRHEVSATRELETQVFIFAHETLLAQLIKARQVAELVIGSPDHDAGPIREAERMWGLRTKTFLVTLHNLTPYWFAAKTTLCILFQYGSLIGKIKDREEKALLILIILVG